MDSAYPFLVAESMESPFTFDRFIIPIYIYIRKYMSRMFSYSFRTHLQLELFRAVSVSQRVSLPAKMSRGIKSSSEQKNVILLFKKFNDFGVCVL